MLEREERWYRGDRQITDLRDRTAIVVDDGMNTGSKMHAADLTLRRLKPSEIIVAVPVASEEAGCVFLERTANRVICIETPAHFMDVGRWNDDFSHPTDEEISNYMDKELKE